MNKHTTIHTDGLNRILIPNEICKKTGITDKAKQSISVGIMPNAIAIGSELPEGTVYGYQCKFDENGRIPLDRFIRAAFNIQENQKVIVENIVEGKYMLVQRYVNSIDDLSIISHVDELGRVHIPSSMKKIIGIDLATSLFTECIINEEGPNYILVVANGDEAQKRESTSLGLISLGDDFKKVNISYPCAVYLNITDNSKILIKRV